MKRFSIRALMVIIVVAAVSLAGLRNANDLWAGAMMTATLMALGVAVMAVVILRGPERVASAGFAFFGIAYLMLAVGPSFGNNVERRLVTTVLLEEFHSALFPTVTPNSPQQQLKAAEEWAQRSYAFQYVGHSLFTFLAAVAGGMIAVRLYEHRERQKHDPGGLSS
jgi:hypothetical protein